MKKRNFYLAVFTFMIINFSLDSAQQKNDELNLMPMPMQVKILDGKHYVNQDFTISINTNSKILYKSAQRALKIITDRSGVFLKEQFPIIKSGGVVNVSIANEVNLEFNIDESYELEITSNSIVINAANNFGAMHGLTTLTQLLESDSEGYYFPNIKIADAPRFTWRGLLIDVSRHFEPVEVIKRNLDAMAAVKMNVMHWHLTDDHGFRIESKVLPKLHELGSDGLYYTQVQIKEIVKYAEERGIRVVPEFDLPGHATAWLVGYPKLASAPGPYEIERQWGIFDPTFDPTKEEVYIFLKKFFEEMNDLFPDEYWHIGGDENNGNQWDTNEAIQKYMKENNLKDNHALQNYFNERIGSILSNLNKTMIGWYTDEMPNLSKDYIVQAWKGRKTLYETAKNGYRSLLSHGFYIDLVQSTEYHYLNDPIPPDSMLTEEVREKIIGGEATMWSEFVGPETIDSRIWPRTAAIAERLWSPSSVNDVPNMFKRLDKISIQLENYGLNHIKNSEMMMRRILGDYEIEHLQNFVSAIQPLYTYSRDRPHVFQSHYPLTRIVDIAVPDPREARIFNKNIETIIGNKSKIEVQKSIKLQLESWRENHTKLLSLIKQKPILKEIEELSNDLMKVSNLGIEALELLNANELPSKDWIEKSNKIIREAKLPKGEVELAILKSITKLVERVKQNKVK